MRKKSIVLGLLLGLFSYSGFSQPFVEKLDSRLNAPLLNWYGLDLSNLIMYDHTQVEKAQVVKESVCPRWIEYFRKYVDNKDLKGWYKLKINDCSYLQDTSYRALDVKNFVQVTFRSDNEYAIDEAAIKTIIQSYSLKETSGLGVVVIVEKLVKSEERAYVIGVFFDVATREILFATREKGSFGGYGLVPLYGNSMIQGVSIIGKRFKRTTLPKVRKL